MRHYATVCREWQLPVLLQSMRRHCGEFKLHVLAWDYDPHDAPWLGPDVVVTPREAFLRRAAGLWDPEMLPGPRRSAIDTVATVRWKYFLDVMADERAPLTTLDGDLWFWSSPEPMFEEIGDAPMAVCPHGIPPASLRLPGVVYETHRRYGLYNAGLVYFSQGGAASLGAMADATSEWSYTMVRKHPVDGLDDFGDQGALERIAHRQKGSVLIVHPGVNAAPWNIHQRGSELVDGQVLVGHRPLIVYHYSSLRLGPRGDVLQVADQGYAVSLEQQRMIYWPYIDAVREQLRLQD